MVLCPAFGAPLLLRQKGAKPSVPAKLAGSRALCGGRAGAGAGFFAGAERARTIAGTFTVVDAVKGQRQSKAKACLAKCFLVVCRVLCPAFGDRLLFRQKSAKPPVPAKLAGGRALCGGRAGAAAGFFAGAERARTIAGTFTVVDAVKGQRQSKAKAGLRWLSGVEALWVRVSGWAFGDLFFLITSRQNHAPPHKPEKVLTRRCICVAKSCPCWRVVGHGHAVALICPTPDPDSSAADTTGDDRAGVCWMN